MDANQKKKLAASLYGVQTFEDAATRAKSFKDAGGIILARNLEHVSPEIFTQEFAGLTFLNSGIVVNNEGGYANSITKLKLAVQGGFKESGSNTNTTGKITLGGESDSMAVFTNEAESDWSEIELKQSELQNINLASRYFEGHAEVYNRDIDALGYIGKLRSDGSVKTPGLLNYTGFDSAAAAKKAEAMTGQELYDAIAGAIVAQWTGVLNQETYKGDRVVMPTRVMNKATSLILNSNGSAATVLFALQANFPGVQFMATEKAEGAGAASVLCVFSINRKAMQFRLPNPLQISSVDQRGHKYYVESFYGVAGLDVIEDGAGYRLTGI